MKQNWFKKAGRLYLPINPMGIMVTFLAILFLVPVYMAIVRNGIQFLMICMRCLCTQHAQHSGGNGLPRKHHEVFLFNIIDTGFLSR